MDLSNLSTSLRESESSTSNRRTSHLRSAEDELNAFFRSSALGLTTLYRQGVAGAKASYDKGYAHALAHVLELWDKDKAWLKGYLQRRIEALEAENNDDEVEEQAIKAQPHQPKAATPAQVGLGESSSIRGRTESGRSGNKRSRALSYSARNQEADSPVAERKTSRMPSTSSGTGFSSGFNFSTPLAMPTHPNSSPTKAHTRSTDPVPSGGGVIKTSTPAAQRRRLQKLKGLRAGDRERVIEIHKQRHEDEMVDDEILTTAQDEEADGDAWTDDDEDNTGVEGREGEGGAKKARRVVWTDHTGKADDGVLERKDRRKRRRTKVVAKDGMMVEGVAEEDELGDSSRERGQDGFAYHSRATST